MDQDRTDGIAGRVIHFKRDERREKMTISSMGNWNVEAKGDPLSPEVWQLTSLIKLYGREQGQVGFVPVRDWAECKIFPFLAWNTGYLDEYWNSSLPETAVAAVTCKVLMIDQ